MKTEISVATLYFLIFQLGATMAMAENLPWTGTLSGRVVADEPVQAAQVYAHNPDTQMTYMVYAIGGQYRAINLMPGTYDVRVEHPDFVADSQRVVVGSGEDAAANFMLRKSDETAPAIVGATRAVPKDIELVAYDDLFPPGGGRDTLERTCMTCHGRNFIPQKSGLNEAGWNALITLMLGLDDSYWGTFGTDGEAREGAVPFLPESISFTDEDRAELVTYLARYFGPGTSPRMVLNDEEVPLDEAALARAMWIEYTAPDATPNGGPDGVFQEQFFDLEGNVWLTEGVGRTGSLVRMDPRTATWTRFPYIEDRYGHGVVTDPMEEDTVLWIAGRGFDVARLDVKTGEYTWYGDTSKTQRWGGHTPVFDSSGTLWYSGIQEDRIGRWDRETDQIKRWQIPTAGGRPYGIIVDQDDKLWFANLHTCTITRFDPVTEEFTEFVSPSAPCTLRRPGLDSKGNIWYGSFSDGMLGKLDPETGEMIEWQIGRFAEPYEAYLDLEDNVWISDGGRNMLAKFDPDTEKFTYYPAPAPHTDRPKIHATRDGAIWYPNRGAAAAGRAPAKSGVLYPDMNKMTTFGAYFAVEDGRAVGTGSPTPAR